MISSFKHFKKVSSDKDKTVLQHKDGHEMTIQHKPLSAEMRSQLDKLPIAYSGQDPIREAHDASRNEPTNYESGGTVKQKGINHSPGKESARPKSEAGYYTRMANQSPEHKESYQAKARGEAHKVLGELQEMPKPKLYAEGGEAQPAQSQQELEAEEQQREHRLDGLMKENYDHAKMRQQKMGLAEGGEVPYSKEGANEIQKGVTGEDIMEALHNIKNQLFGGNKNAPSPTPTQTPNQYAKGGETQKSENDLSDIIGQNSDTIPANDPTFDPNQYSNPEQAQFEQNIQEAKGSTAGAGGKFGTQAAPISQDVAENQALRNTYQQNNPEPPAPNPVTGANLQAAGKMGLRLPEQPQIANPNSQNNGMGVAGMGGAGQAMPASYSTQQSGESAPQSPLPAGAQNPNDPLGIESAAATSALGSNLQETGIAGEAQALGQIGTDQAAALQKGIQAQQALLGGIQHHMNEGYQEYQHFINDYNQQHVDPNHYLNSMGTAGKISTAIGLILGGFGGPNNGAQKFLEQQIDRDVKSQEFNITKQQNLLAANHAHMADLTAAGYMTTAMQAGIIQNRLLQAAAKSQDPLAASRAQMAAGALERDVVAPNIAKYGMQRSMVGAMGNSQNDPDAQAHFIRSMMMINPEMGEKYNKAFVPGVGLSQSLQPIPDDVRQNIVARNTAAQELTRLRRWAVEHTGTLNPKDWAYGKSLAAEVSSLYQSANLGGGKSTEGDRDFIGSVVSGNPSSPINSIKILPQLDSIIKSNQIRLDQVKKGYGLPIQQIDAQPGHR